MRITGRGFSLIEVMVMMGVSILLGLGTVSMIQSFSKSAKQMKQLADLNVVSSLLQSQLQQMSSTDCPKYFPSALNPHIHTSTDSDPSDITTQTQLSIQTETSTGVERIAAAGSTINGMLYKLVLTTTDNVCDTNPATFCSGTLNLLITRPQDGKSYGMSNFSNGYYQGQGFVADIQFQVASSDGAMTNCSYVPPAIGGQIDYGTCRYYADASYKPTLSGGAGQQVVCPASYVTLTACANGCGGPSTSLLCCRLRNPEQMYSVLTHSSAPYWANSCNIGDPVTGACSGGGCANNVRCTPIPNSQVATGLCHYVGLGGWAQCKPWEFITNICPAGASCTNPGNIMCCPIYH